MPEFEVMPREEAQIRSEAGRRAQQAREYLEYIERLGENEAGRLSPSEGERVSTLRRHLKDAARLAGKDLVIRRSGDEGIWKRDDPPMPSPPTGDSRPSHLGSTSASIRLSAS